MRYADYSQHFFGRLPMPGLVSVGWCDARGYPSGEVRPGLVSRLYELAGTNMANTQRGFDLCDICGERVPFGLGVTDFWLGNAEIWVPAQGGAWYCAPNLIIHYIRDHGYLPPAEFQEAVFASHLPPGAVEAFEDTVADRYDQLTDEMEEQGLELPEGRPARDPEGGPGPGG